MYFIIYILVIVIDICSASSDIEFQYLEGMIIFMSIHW